MGMLAIFADGVALMLGSLLAAVMLAFGAWWIGDTLRRPWVSLVLLIVLVTFLLASPLERSLFVRMVTVFEIASLGLLFFIWRDDGYSDRGHDL